MEKSSSEVEVLSNDDLLAEIMSHVSARTLMCLKLVSKQWLSLITGKTLSLIHHRRRTTTTAIFLRSNAAPSYVKYLRLDFNSDDNSHAAPSENLDVDISRNLVQHWTVNSTAFSHDPIKASSVHILQSCHGLLLFRTGGVGIVNKYSHTKNSHALYYYVYNPTTNRVATIYRKWYRETTIHASVLVFNPDKSPHYRVVFFLNTPPLLTPGQIQCQVYSSEFGTWKVSSQHPFVPCFDITMHDFAYFKGCIYWTSESSLWTEILYYNVDEDVFGTLSRPGNLPKYPMTRCHLYFGESGGHLHLVETFPGQAARLDVYELNSDRSGWFWKYMVHLTRLIARYFPWMSTDNIFSNFNEYAFVIHTLVRQEHIDDEDSVLVLEMPGWYIVYNLINHTWKVIGQSQYDPELWGTIELLTTLNL